MILLTRLNNSSFYLNCDLIEQIEGIPDTVITLTTGKRIVVEETSERIIEKIIHFRNRCIGVSGEGTEFKASSVHKDRL